MAGSRGTAEHVSVPVKKMEPQGDESSDDSSVKLGSSSPSAPATPTGRGSEHGVDDGEAADDGGECEQVRSMLGTLESMRASQKKPCVKSPRRSPHDLAEVWSKHGRT